MHQHVSSTPVVHQSTIRRKQSFFGREGLKEHETSHESETIHPDVQTLDRHCHIRRQRLQGVAFITNDQIEATVQVLLPCTMWLIAEFIRFGFGHCHSIRAILTESCRPMDGGRRRSCSHQSRHEAFKQPTQPHHSKNEELEKTTTSGELVRPTRLRLSQPRRPSTETLEEIRRTRLSTRIPIKKARDGSSRLDSTEIHKQYTDSGASIKHSATNIGGENVHQIFSHLIRKYIIVPAYVISCSGFSNAIEWRAFLCVTDPSLITSAQSHPLPPDPCHMPTPTFEHSMMVFLLAILPSYSQPVLM